MVCRAFIPLLAIGLMSGCASVRKPVIQAVKDPVGRLDGPERVSGKGAPFTVTCSGVYESLIHRNSEVAFFATIYPEFGRGVVFDITGRGLGEGNPRTFEAPKAFLDMEDAVSELYRIDDQRLKLGNVRFNRQTGGFKVAGLSGDCIETDFVEVGVKDGRQF